MSPTRTVVPTRTISPSEARRPTAAADIADPKRRQPDPERQRPGRDPGIAMTARPDPDGSFFVSEVITLPAAVTEVAVRPASIGDAGIGFERLRPTATNVEVTAGGQALVVPDGPITSEVTLHWA